eukprot:GHVR01073462.1.p1 GENE.GHVR01073462.1~~GHVR01073462.1.p1  ORF type:complete len:119 (+),score=4.53 GHVR01073462.1:36-392(+)
MLNFAILTGGVIFYFFVITRLILTIKDDNFNKSFLRLIDSNDDGIITSKEMKNFTVCQGYDGKKIQKEFSEFGRKADLNDLAGELSSSIILNSIKKCVGDVSKVSNPEILMTMKKNVI